MSGAADVPTMKPVSLYVGDLHTLVSDASLFSKFSEVGPVLNARVCRDMFTRESLGYGYVNFHNPADAEAAMENINFAVMYGRPMRLMWSHKDPSVRKSGKGNVFVKNLDKNIVPVELYDTFEQFGAILSCKLALDDKNQSRGFGFVHFEREESAQKAIAAVNGKKLKDRVVYVGPFIPKSERKANSNATKFNNCYVKNFGDDVDDKKFHDMFAKYGAIKSACVMRSDQGESKGFGFVCFEEASSAEAAVKEMNGMELNGKPLYVGRAQRKEERQEELKQRYEKQRTERQSRYANGVNLYVKNLDDSIDDEKLTEAFSQFGEITSAKVMRDSKGVSRSFGFVCFRTAENATVAVTKMNSRMLGNKPLYVAIAQRKEDRKAKLTAEYQARMDQARTNLYPIHPGIPYLSHGSFPQNQRYFTQNSMLGARPRWQQTAAAGPNPTAAHYMPQQAGAAAMQGSAFGGQMPLQMRGQAAAVAGLGRQGGPGGMPAFLGAGGVTRQQQAGQGQSQQAPPSQQQVSQVQQAAVQQRQQAMGMGTRPNMAAVAGNAVAQQMRGGPGMQGGQVSAVVGGGGGGNGPAVRYHQNARNVMPQQQQAQQQQAHGQAQEEAQRQAQEAQRMQLGTRLYQVIEQMYPQFVGKLTGVMLSLEPSVLNELFDDEARLREKVHEAYSLLAAKAENEGGDAKKTEKAAAK